MSKLNKYLVTVWDRITGDHWEDAFWARDEVTAAFLFIVNETDLGFDQNLDRSNYTLQDLEDEFDIEHGVTIIVEKTTS